MSTSKNQIVQIQLHQGCFTWQDQDALTLLLMVVL